MVSIVTSLGTPNWKNVKLPPNRSLMACKHVYFKAVSEARGISKGNNTNSDGTKKRGRPKKVTSEDTKGGNKRKRGGNDEGMPGQESEISEDEEVDSKKPKEDIQSDEKQEIKLEADEI